MASLYLTNQASLADVLRQGQGVLNVLPLGGVKQEVDAAIVELRPVAEQLDAQISGRRAVGDS